MGASTYLYYLAHPNQLRALLQWKIWHTPLHERNPATEAPTLRRCFEFLKMTSRSFATVIQELTPELCVPVALFYLILRGLDTIEDDMTLPLEEKEPILRTFHENLDKPGWAFTKSGPNEKDRQLLVEFSTIGEEFAKIKKPYREIIKDIARKMGNGMADYANNAEHNINGVNTIEDYDLYCHYVAGLVGEGLTALFCEAKLANPVLLERPHLSNAMGNFLQKTNIIRDYREDLDDGRRFWPKEIWSKHIDEFKDLADPKNEEVALNCISEMCLDALRHADECLFYLAGIKDQSVFNFAAIPQVMAIATLNLVFRNKDVFQKNVKIAKGEACELMLEASNLRSVCAVFRKYAKKIRQKNTPKDPNFLRISTACAKIDQFIESIFPTPTDPAVIARQRQLEATGETPEEAALAKKEMMMLIAAVIGTLSVISAFMIFLAWLAGARFDLAFQDMKGTLSKVANLGEAQAPASMTTLVAETVTTAAHVEL
ncbi:isoprenoid synthase domain-containing protein [Kalaharituber pfeilii]|nr:isoprenoid synthase domain-containing protein [Kalaharituber pfeilii]